MHKSDPEPDRVVTSMLPRDGVGSRSRTTARLRSHRMAHRGEPLTPQLLKRGLRQHGMILCLRLGGGRRRRRRDCRCRRRWQRRWRRRPQPGRLHVSCSSICMCMHMHVTRCLCIPCKCTGNPQHNAQRNALLVGRTVRRGRCRTATSTSGCPSCSARRARRAASSSAAEASRSRCDWSSSSSRASLACCRSAPTKG